MRAREAGSVRRPAILAVGTIATAVVLAACAVTVASALTPPHPVQVLDDDGVDTSATAPGPAPTVASPAAPAPGGPGRPAPREGGGVVAVPPAGPVVLEDGGRGTAGDGVSAPTAGDGATADDPGAGEDAPDPGSAPGAPDRTPGGAHEGTGRDHAHDHGRGQDEGGDGDRAGDRG
jgi:hypothetical protein